MSGVRSEKQQALVPRALKELSGLGIATPAKAEVREYLGAHPDLAEILPQLCMQARASLPAGVQLSLELYHEHESEEEYLVLNVRQASYDADLLDRIEAASEGFDAILRDRSGWLLLTTDYRQSS